MDEISTDGYELEIVPIKAVEENKTGITIKGKDSEYIEAHRILKQYFQTRGQKYHINGSDIRIVDLPKNKLIKIEVKHKGGMSGKVNLNIYEVNARGGATIMVQKVSGGGFEHVKIFGLKVIKHLIDGLISGSMDEDSIEKYKIKTEKIALKEERNPIDQKIKCEKCDKIFKSDQGLKVHMTRTHKGSQADCDSCERVFDSYDKLEKHIESKHGQISSPLAKKQKQNPEEIKIEEYIEEIHDKLKVFEKCSWEEMRLEHRFVETEVSEEEIEKWRSIMNRREEIRLMKLIKQWKN